LSAKYFAYGSNMDAVQMRERGAPFTARKWALLRGYSLRFNKLATGKDARSGEGKGNIVPNPNGVTEGALYEITQAGLDGLDEREGYPEHYARVELPVELKGGSQVKAWVYIAQHAFVREGLLPTHKYLGHYLQGEDLLTPEYFWALARTRTIMDAGDLRARCEEFDGREGRASFYRLAAEIVDVYPVHASVIILATWNVGRFRFYASDGQILEKLTAAIVQSGPTVAKLKDETLSGADLSSLRDDIARMYDALSAIKGVEYTGASKIMHLLNRELYVMWDSYISEHYGFRDRDGTDYAEFLALMKSLFGGVEWIYTDRTLAKAVDEFNYVTITIPAQLKEKEKQARRRT
jgi:hypothetical protein